jgi:adenosylcobinamide kinase/adenosylcobinamide-phosphate guanylyltransferase
MVGGGHDEGMLRYPCDATGKSGARPALPPQLSAASPRHWPLLSRNGGGKAPPAMTPSQETSASRLSMELIIERLNGTVPRAEETPLLLSDAGSDAGIPCPAGALPRLTLVLGGARSGKSRYAESLVEVAARCGTYCATAEPGDAEMAARIAAHRARRGPFWRTVEAPLRLAEAISAKARPDRPVLVDCLTLWLSNLMLAGARLDEEIATLRVALRDAAGPVVLVANEVGLGLVPETPLGRHFRDAAGWLNQDIAALAERVVFVAAGLPLVLKDAVMPLTPTLPLNGGEGEYGERL